MNTDKLSTGGGPLSAKSKKSEGELCGDRPREGLDKRTVLQALKSMSEQAGFLFASEAKSVLALDGLEHMNPGFVDRLIHGESERQGMPVLSCEKSFRHLINAEVIP